MTIIKTVGLVGVAALALGACGGPTVEGGGGTPTTPAAGGDATTPGGETTEAGFDWSSVEPATEIAFWTNHPGGSMDIEKELVEKFTAETGITVDHVTAGANYAEVSQRFQTAQVSGDQGDVVVLSDANWFSAYLAGSIAPVDEILAAADVDASNYVDALYEDYLYEGEHWAVPYARSTPLFYYNKEHYADAGLPDRAPESWAEMEEFAAQLTEAGHTTAFAYPPEAEYPAWTMANLVWGFGGQWSDEWDFSAAHSAETIEATIEAAGFEIGVGFLPVGPSGDEKVVPTGGAGLAVASKSTPEQQLAAAMFVSYITNAENTAAFSGATGYLPVTKGADMSAKYAEQPLFEVAVDQLERARVQDFGRVLLPGGDIALSRGLSEVLVQKTDPAATMQKVADEMQSLYDRDLKAVLG